MIAERHSAAMGAGMTNRLDDLLLRLFRQGLRAPDAESGLAELAGDGGDTEDWRQAVREATAARLIHDPVRLPPGALQCHWHLELTATGVDAARRLRRED